MKPLKTKAQIRAEIEQAMASYVGDGGSVREVPRGTSGIADNVNLFAHGFSTKPSERRTSVNNVVQAIDARKKPVNHASRRPKKKLITDDFGEPLRWVWEEDQR